MNKKIVVIGGGAAGMMAALSAAEQGAQVTLLEPNERLGKKLNITGKGRCNVTNNTDIEGLLANIPCNGKFLYSAFNRFNSADTMNFFEKLGVQLKTERGNRVFPVSDSAFDISAALERRLKALKVQVLRDRASALKIEDGAVCGVVGERGRYSAQAVVLATGGYSYNEDLLKMAGFENVISCAPSTSDGSGFLLAQAVGGVFDNMDEIVNYYGGGIPTNGFDMYYQVNNSYPGMIYVNAQGDRVGAEESATSAMWYGQEESKLYAVISGNMIDEEQAFIKHPMMNSAVLENNGWDKLEELAAAGNCVYKDDTLEELAEVGRAACRDRG